MVFQNFNLFPHMAALENIEPWHWIAPAAVGQYAQPKLDTSVEASARGGSTGMSDVPDDLVALFVNYAANVAADFTKTGVGFLARKLRKDPQTAAPIRERLNMSLQAELVARGVGDSGAIKVANYILDEADLAYLLTMWEAADSSFEDQSSAFRRELRAHLRFEGRIEEDLEPITDLFIAVLSRAGTSYLAAERHRRATLGVHPHGARTRPSGTLLFSDQQSRSRQFQIAGTSSLSDLEAFTVRYLEKTRETFHALRLQHLGPRRSELAMDDLFVPPRFGRESGSPYPLTTSELLMAEKRIVILGPAGSGKLTAVRHAALQLARLNSVHVVPVLIELRTTGKIAKETGTLFVNLIRGDITERTQEEPPEGWLEYLLLSGRAFVFFDGFDEVLSAGRRSEIRDAIRSFGQLYPASSVVVTSRITGYDLAPLPENFFEHALIEELDDPQVGLYVKLWFEYTSRGNANPADLTADAFLDESAEYAADIRVNPLMLSLLCSVYYSRGDIPRTLGDLYEQCASLLYHQWNTMRGIEDHGAWSPDLRPAIYHIADLIINNGDYLANGIPEATLKLELARYWKTEQDFEWTDATAQANRLVDIWAGRAWLITAVSSDADNRPRLGFVHQSFLEYFAAVFAVRAVDNAAELLGRLRERLIYLNGWSIAQLAISTFNRQRESGGNSFVAELVHDAAVSSPAEQMALLRFALAVSAMFRLKTETRVALLRQILLVAAGSIVLPVDDETLEDIHGESRFRDQEWSSLVIDDDDDIDAQVDAITLQHLYSKVQLSTLQTEKLIIQMVRAYEDEPRFDEELGLACKTIVVDETTVSQVVAASAFVLSLARSVGVLLPELLTEVGALVKSTRSDLSWYAILAAVTVGAIEASEYAQLLPWHVLLRRDVVAISLEHDFLSPEWLTGSIAQLGSSDHLLVLEAAGRSLLDQINETDVRSKLKLKGMKDGLTVDQPLNADAIVRWEKWSEESVVGFAGLVSLVQDSWDGTSWFQIQKSGTGEELIFVEAFNGSILELSINPSWSEKTRSIVTSLASGEIDLTTVPVFDPNS